MSHDGPEATKPASSGSILGSVGPYQLVEELPQRREVLEYLARQRGPGGFERWCTLKIAKRSSDARAAEALSREAKVMARLDHPNIVRFHDFFEHEASLVLVLERFSGLTLERFVELSSQGNAKLDDRIIWHVALSLFDALAHAHGLADQAGQPSPILHRDVRPGNVLVASDGRVRLTGFAFARDVDLDESTACAAVYRAPSYVAPEVVRATEATDRGDAFSAALVLWELLTGRSGTRQGLTDFELLKHLASRVLESLRTARPDIPALVATALDACLMTDPAERRIGCGEVAGCIRAGLDLGEGAGVLREAVAALGPSVERLAGGKAAAPRTQPHLTVQLAEAPHRPEALTIPDTAPTSGVGGGPTAGAAMPAILVPAAQPALGGPGAREKPTPAPERAAEPPEAAARLVQMPEAPTGPDDDDILAMKASEGRRRTVRLAMMGGPLVLTLCALGVALGEGVCTRTDSGEGQPSLSTTVQPVAPIVESPAARSSEPAPDGSVRPGRTTESLSVPAKQAMLIVRGPPEGDVYVMGRPVGRTDEPILTECGQRFVRVGSPVRPGGMSGVRWQGAGRSVLLRCGEKTVVPAGE